MYAVILFGMGGFYTFFRLLWSGGYVALGVWGVGGVGMEGSNRFV